MKLNTYTSELDSGNVTCRVGVTIQQQTSTITFVLSDAELTQNAVASGRETWSEDDICQLGSLLVGAEITHLDNLIG